MPYENTKYSTFAADVADWVRETEGVLLNVIRESVDEAVHEMQIPKSEGGRMPVDTGFLRSSGMSSLNGWPSGPDDKPDDALPNSYKWDGESVSVTLSNFNLGDTFYFGWTAVYALKQETYNGFLGATAQNWQSIVDANVARLKDG